MDHAIGHAGYTRVRTLDPGTKSSFIGQTAYRTFFIELDAVDGHFQRVAGLRTVNIDRPGGRIDSIPIDLFHYVLGIAKLISEAVHGFEIQVYRDIYFDCRFIFVTKAVEYLVCRNFHVCSSYTDLVLK